ncbi:MAG: CIS tube protein [Chloroflexota bacterium]
MQNTNHMPMPASPNGASLPLPKAQIINLDRPGDGHIECMFNPKEYSIAKKNNWNAGKSTGTNIPKQQFGGGQPATLTMQLFFDTYVGSQGSRDVRTEYTQKIWHLAEVDDDLSDNTTTRGRPPKVRFQWGPAWSFEAVITSITQKFTLFSSDGTPVRATLDVTFQQVVDEGHHPPQNPTSGGIGGERQWTVKDGDSLASIAYEVYGDSSRWRAVAEVNRLTRVRDLRPGAILGLAPRA